MPESILVVLAPAAQHDIENALAWSRERFGARAAIRYRSLIKQAIRDVATDPERAGSRKRPELGPRIWSYHLQFTNSAVKRPRHFLIYRRDKTRLELIRLLHDSRDLEQHLPPD